MKRVKDSVALLRRTPDQLRLAGLAAWRGKERGLAVFAGVFLASLVMATVIGYGAGLSQIFLQEGLQNEFFDAKIDFDQEPNENNTGRTNDSMLWSSVCNELIDRESGEISDCGLVFGRQGIHASGFFNDETLRAQPLNVVSINNGMGKWANVSFDYPEASENGPPINDDRILRFYGDTLWSGELGERHAAKVLYGEWPESGEIALEKRAIVLPSQIASRSGVQINETIDVMTFTYVTDYGSYKDPIPDEECSGEIEVERNEYEYCRIEMNVTNMTVVAIYEESFGNPTLGFNPVIVPVGILNSSQQVTLMDNDHGYLAIAVDRSQLPTASTSDAANWLDDLKESVEGQNYTSSEIEIEYVDIVSGSITFFEIFLGLIQVFDYILMIPIILLSISVLVYGLILSLEQRRREISIHRVIGGTSTGMQRMVLLEVFVIAFAAWAIGYVLAPLVVPLVLDAVGFMSFRSGDYEVDATLSMTGTCMVAIVSIGLALLFARSRTREFISLEIDEGVRQVAKKREPRLWLHWLMFLYGLLALLESWIQSEGGWWIWDGSGLVENFFLNALLLLFGPFFLWIGGALVLSRIGSTGPRVLEFLFGRTAALKDIRRGLRGSGSSESINRLATIMLLTLSIVTLAAVQGYTGTLVDERTASVQSGSDLQVNFNRPMTNDQAVSEVNAALERLDYSTGFESTAVGSLFSSIQNEGAQLVTWVVFENHDEVLMWDTQSLSESKSDTFEEWESRGFTAGGEAVDVLDFPDSGRSGAEFVLEHRRSIVVGYTAFNDTIIPIFDNSTVANTTVSYTGRHYWVPGLDTATAEQAIVIGEISYRELVGDATADNFTSNRWFFDLGSFSDDDDGSKLRRLRVELDSSINVTTTSDWSTVHRDIERNGGLIFGTPGLLSLQFVVASVASVASAFVFLSLVLSQRKRELAILQAIGASPNQVTRLVLFEILSIIIVSMVLGVLLGLGISWAFNGFFGIFGFIFQIFLGSGTPIDRELIWPWFELGLVNGSVLLAVFIALFFTTRRALKSDLAMVLKGE